VAAERSDESGEWLVLRDWQAVRRLNELLGNLGALRRSWTPPKDRTGVQVSLVAASQVIEQEVPKLNTGFLVPCVEALAVLWPGAEPGGPGDRAETAQDDMNDFEE
jgi:hypothetical protein